MKLLKYLNIAFVRVDPLATWRRIVSVKDREPVACCDG
jgi:hypothetical protein